VSVIVRECVWVCVREREGEKQRKKMCLREIDRKRVCMFMCVCLCVCERERESVKRGKKSLEMQVSVNLSKRNFCRFFFTRFSFRFYADWTTLFPHLRTDEMSGFVIWKNKRKERKANFPIRTGFQLKSGADPIYRIVS